MSDELPATAAAVRSYHSIFGGADAGAVGHTLHGASKSVRVFMTGDLAFYSTILGKEHVSGTWCPYCDLPHSNWQDYGHRAGKMWTLDELKTHLHKLESGDLNKNIPREGKGVTASLIFGAIPLENWICPVLHMCIGIGNGLLSQFLDFVDKRIENLPTGLADLRATTIRLAVELEDYIEEDFEEWMHTGGSELATLVLEKATDCLKTRQW